eukprot:9492780-Pyramimonas_sp.AAC.1
MAWTPTATTTTILRTCDPPNSLNFICLSPILHQPVNSTNQTFWEARLFRPAHGRNIQRWSPCAHRAAMAVMRATNVMLNCEKAFGESA